MKAREGDLIETFDGNIFDVKGLIHPPHRIVAFIRYIPDPEGDRIRDGVTYRKIYPLKDRYKLLQKRFSQYLVVDQVFDEQLCEVPIKSIRLFYRPVDCLKQLRSKRRRSKLQDMAVSFSYLVKESAEVPWSAIGISGSIPVRLDTQRSDIDLIVYGSQNCHRVYNSFKMLVNDKSSAIRRYNLSELGELFDFRSRDTVTSFEDFVRTESRKVLQGKFNRTDYFVRFVKDWNEVTEEYGEVQYSAEGYVRIKAKIVDDSKAIYTPCTYKIENVKVLEGSSIKDPITEISSFRGRFCEQAFEDETVIAQGKIERVQYPDGRMHLRLLLGNRISDYMIPH